MIELYSKVLEVLLKLLDSAFSNSSSNRKRLHDIEWDEEDSSPSILGEVEIRADAVIGIARACLEKDHIDISEFIDILEANSVYGSEAIVNWVANDGGDFQEFLQYLAAVENLRTGMMALLNKS